MVDGDRTKYSFMNLQYICCFRQGGVETCLFSLSSFSHRGQGLAYTSVLSSTSEDDLAHRPGLLANIN